MMKIEDIKNEEMVIRFIEGCLSDMELGIASKQETDTQMNKLIIYLINLDRKKRFKLIESAFLAGRSDTSWAQFKIDNRL